VGLGRGVAEHRRALGGDGGSQRIFRGSDAGLVEEDVRAFQFLRLEDEGIVHLEGGTELLERQEVRVHASAADDIAARGRKNELTAPCEEGSGQQNGRPDLLAEHGIELCSTHGLRVDSEGIPAGPLRTRADRLEQQDQRLHVLDARHVGQVNRLVAEEGRGDDGECGVLVARGADASGEALASLNDVLHGWHE